MKKGSICILIFLLSTLSLYAQEETLLSEGKIVHGGYGGPEVKFTTINNNSGLLVGGRGGWIINHTIVLGGGGYGLTNAIKAKVPGNTTEGKYLDFGYGGFQIEWIIKSDKLIHFSISSLIGGGGVGYRRDLGDNDSNNRSDACLVVEPGATAELNVTKFFRISLGTSYRYVSGVNSEASSNNSLSGLSVSLLLRFGKF